MQCFQEAGANVKMAILRVAKVVNIISDVISDEMRIRDFKKRRKQSAAIGDSPLVEMRKQ